MRQAEVAAADIRSLRTTCEPVESKKDESTERQLPNESAPVGGAAHCLCKSVNGHLIPFAVRTTLRH